MKTKFLALVLLLFTLQTLSAQKCKPMSKETDPFTGITTTTYGAKLTSMSVFSFGVKYVPYFGVFNYEGKKRAFLQLDIDGFLSNEMLLNKHVWFEKGTKLLIKLENEVVELTVIDSVVRNNHVFLVYDITDNQINKLKSQKLIVAKCLPFMNNEDFFFKFKIAKGRDKKLKEQLECFTN